MCRTGVLAIYDLVKIFRVLYVGRIQGLIHLSRMQNRSAARHKNSHEPIENNSNLICRGIASRILHFVTNIPVKNLPGQSSPGVPVRFI